MQKMISLTTLKWRNCHFCGNNLIKSNSQIEVVDLQNYSSSSNLYHNKCFNILKMDDYFMKKTKKKGGKGKKC